MIAATNQDLRAALEQGTFREDLYYRLNVVPIEIPPLRERKNDIEALATYFIEKFNQHHKKNISALAPDAMELLKAHSWPGNIRELENVIEHAFVIETSTQLTPSSLPASITGTSSKGLTTAIVLNGAAEVKMEGATAAAISIGSGAIGLSVAGRGFTLDINRLDFQANKEEFERQFLISALKAFKGRINQTALHANIPKKTLLRKLQKYGISAREYN